MNLNNYLEYISLKLYATDFFKGHNVERYNYKSFSFEFIREKDIIKILSQYNKNQTLIEVSTLEIKSFNINNLLIMLELIEQAYDKKYTTHS